MNRWAQSIREILLGNVSVGWSPPETSVIFLRREGAQIMSLLFEEGSFLVLDWRVGKVYLKPLIMAVFDRPRGGRVLSQYVAQYVRLAKCHLVVSFMDQTGALANAKLRAPLAKTVAFQNGIMSRHEPERIALMNRGLLADLTFGISNPRVSDGPPEETGYLLTGSLKTNAVRVISGELRQSVLFLSQWRPDLAGTDFYSPEQTLLPALADWAKQHQLTLEVLGASENEASSELRFFETLIRNREFRMIPRDSRSFATGYEKVDGAKVVVSIDSTLGVEALFRNKATFFFSDGNRLFHPITTIQRRGPFWVTDGDIDAFWELLEVSVSEDGSREFQLSSSALLEEWDPDPGFVKTREQILRICPQLADKVRKLDEPVFWERNVAEIKVAEQF